MNCADFGRLAPELLYGLVPPERRTEAMAHLRTCTACRTAFEALKQRMCSEIIHALDDYLTAAMTPPERATFDAHLAVCPDCRNYLASYEATMRLSKSAFAPPAAATTPPPPLPSELIAAVLAARKRANP